MYQISTCLHFYEEKIFDINAPFLNFSETWTIIIIVRGEDIKIRKSIWKSIFIISGCFEMTFEIIFCPSRF